MPSWMTSALSHPPPRTSDGIPFLWCLCKTRVWNHSVKLDGVACLWLDSCDLCDLGLRCRAGGCNHIRAQNCAWTSSRACRCICIICPPMGACEWNETCVQTYCWFENGEILPNGKIESQCCCKYSILSMKPNSNQKYQAWNACAQRPLWSIPCSTIQPCGQCCTSEPQLGSSDR